jgi:ankyrin repeat protein
VKHLSTALLVLGLAALGQAATNGPFYLPIRNNDLAALRTLIHDSGPQSRDGRGNTPLLYAAAVGSLDSMRLLLDAGADPNAANSVGATPLMWSASDTAKVRLLLAKRAKVNARSLLGETPLLIAAAYDGSLETARLLIENGADVNARDKGGVSALENAAGNNNVALARLLIEKGADVNNADAGGSTPLMQAAGSDERDAATVKLLLEHGAKVNNQTAEVGEVVKNGPIALGHLTALQLAAEMGNYDAVEALVKAGADIEAKDVRSATPLVHAVAIDQANPKVVALLLEKGAVREPALDWVRRYQNPAILSLFGLSASNPAEPALAAKPQRTPADAITKAFAISQPVASKFMANGGCVACHSQSMNGLAVSMAKDRAIGRAIQADYQLEARLAHDTRTFAGIYEQQYFQGQNFGGGVLQVEWQLLQMAAAGVEPTLSIDSMVHNIASMQRKEGDWPMCCRAPLQDGAFTTTAKAVRALRVYPIPGRKSEFDARIARAAAWLESAEPLTTEDRSMQILGLAWADRKVPADRVKQLLIRQRPNGGWGQTNNLPADAYATGEVLWALHEAGIPPSDPAFRRGIDFLLRAQQDDGTWHVVSRALGIQPYFQSGFPYDHDQWISQAGTAMATIALTLAAEPAATETATAALTQH